MKRVDTKIYTTNYYLSDCSGHKEFIKSMGMELEPRFNILLSKLKSVSRKNILDIGCG